MLKRQTTNIKRHSVATRRKLSRVPRQAYNEFVRRTPKRSGNAKRNTNFGNDSIHGDYDYVNRLNDGYSKQAPTGMTDPVISYIRRLIFK